MSTASIINIVLSAIVALTAIVSIFIAIITLRVNSKMVENSTRPYIVIYSTKIDGLSYFIVKNYGSSMAIVDEIKCSHIFTQAEIGYDKGQIFDKMKNSLFAPGQSIQCPVISHELKNFDFSFSIKYHSSTHTYSDDFNFNLIANNPFPYMSSGKVDVMSELHNIYQTLLEILKCKM